MVHHAALLGHLGPAPHPHDPPLRCHPSLHKELIILNRTSSCHLMPSNYGHARTSKAFPALGCSTLLLCMYKPAAALEASHTAHWLVLDSSVEASHADSSVQRHRADPDDRAAAGPAAPAAPRPGQRPAHCGHSLPSSSQSMEDVARRWAWTGNARRGPALTILN